MRFLPVITWYLWNSGIGDSIHPMKQPYTLKSPDTVVCNKKYIKREEK